MYYVNQIQDAGAIIYIVEQSRRANTVLSFADAHEADCFTAHLNREPSPDRQEHPVPAPSSAIDNLEGSQ